MKARWILVTAVLVGAFFSFATGQTTPQKGVEVDKEGLAQKVVNQCAGIREGDLVLISGGVRDIELLENIAVHVRKAGAFPLVTIDSDRMTRRMFTDVPPKYDSQTPEFYMKLLGFITATINVDYNEVMDLLADIPAERRAAMSKASAPATDLFTERKIRGVNLGNGLYPTAALAKQYGVSKEELSKVFWDGVNVDYQKLQKTCDAVKTLLEKGKEIRITNTNGTNLSLGIAGRPVFASDGVITGEDLQKGFAASQVYLPAGEVYLAPVPGTADGKVVVDRLFYQGKEILGFTLEFKAGKLTSMSAKSGLDPLKSMYDASEAGKELFGFVDFGTNPAVVLKTGSKMVAWMPAGMVTVGLGNNLWAGGENKSPYGLSCHLPGSTVAVDGKVLVEKGVPKF